MNEVAKILGLLLASGTKFFISPSASVIAGYNFWETIAITTLGGILGFLLFFKFGEVIRWFFSKLLGKKQNPRFTKRNRFIVKVKSKYGLYGIAILTPCLFSIPLGAFLASIFYSKDRRTIPVFVASIVTWSFILTGFSLLVI